MSGYARYPAVDFVSHYDFQNGCPSMLTEEALGASAFNLTVHSSASHYCWVSGSLQVRSTLRPITLACKCCCHSLLRP